MRALLSLLFAAGLCAAPPAARKEALRVPVWVQAGEGKSESELLREELSVKVSGSPPTRPGCLGPRTTWCCWWSPTWPGTSRWRSWPSALSTSASKVAAQRAGGLLRAQDGLRVLVDPTADRAAIKAAIERCR